MLSIKAKRPREKFKFKKVEGQETLPEVIKAFIDKGYHPRMTISVSKATAGGLSTTKLYDGSVDNSFPGYFDHPVTDGEIRFEYEHAPLRSADWPVTTEFGFYPRLNLSTDPRHSGRIHHILVGPIIDEETDDMHNHIPCTAAKRVSYLEHMAPWDVTY